MFRRRLIKKQIDLCNKYDYLMIWHGNIINEINRVKITSSANDVNALVYIRRLRRAEKRARRDMSKVYRKMFKLYENYGITSPHLNIRS